jgi:glycosyl transferase family 25
MHAFVISLDTSSGRARMKHLKEHADSKGISLEHVRAVHGAVLTPEELGRATTILCETTCTPAMVGCAMSHVKVWNMIVERQMPYAIVLEDDVRLSDNVVQVVEEIITRYISVVDLVLLGCFACDPTMQKVWATLGAASFTNPPLDDATIDPAVMYPVRRFGGTHAYVITLEGARTLLKAIEGQISYHVDFQMSSIQDLRVYALRNPVAWQDDWDASENANLAAFPHLINQYARRVHVGGDTATLAYWLNVGICRLGTWNYHAVLTPWHALLLLLGALSSGHVSWMFLVMLVVLDLTFGKISLDATNWASSDTTSRVAMLVFGRIIMEKKNLLAL